VWTALWAVYIIWGSTYLAIKVTVDTLPPLLAVSTRFILAGTIMAGIVLWRGGSLRVSRRALGSCVLIGLLLPGANAVLFYAERDVPTGLASLLIASVPLLVVVLRLFARERMPAAALAGVGVGFAGVAVLVRPSGGATNHKRGARGTQRVEGALYFPFGFAVECGGWLVEQQDWRVLEEGAGNRDTCTLAA
jgi:drug/metabolite transporter (DMT)-like permease